MIGFKIIIEAVFAFFPILSSHYWFATAYIILLLLAPFFNLLINAMERNQYKYLLICIISIFVIIEGGIPYALYQMFDGRLVPMIIYYFIAGYIKRFVTISEISSYKCIAIAAVFYILLWTSSYFITYIGYLLNNETIMGACYFYRRINSPIVVIIAVALFIGFLSLKMEEIILVNTVAISTFGVYLLHGNRIILNYLTVYISSIADDVKNPITILLYAILLPSGIYVVCTVVDWIRQKTVGKLWSLLIDRKSRYLDTKCRSVIEGLLRKCALLGKVVCVNEVKNI